MTDIVWGFKLEPACKRPLPVKNRKCKKCPGYKHSRRSPPSLQTIGVSTPGPSRQVICVVNGPLAEAGEGVAYIGKLIPGMWVRGTWFAQQQNGHNHDRQPNTFLDISLFQKKWPPSHCNEYRATGYQVLGFGAYRAVTYWAVA